MNGVSKITLSEDVALVTFNRIGSDLKLISAVFSDFAKAGVNIDMISQTTPTGDSVSVSFSVRSSDLVTVLSLINHYKAQYPDVLPLVSSGNCKIQMFGQEMREMEGVAARVIATAAQSEAHVLMITTSEVDISLLLSDFNLEQLVDALEQAFQVKVSHA